MIALIEGIVRRARNGSRRIDAACAEMSATWINHSLITLLLGGGIGGALGFAFGIPHLGFRIGLLVALLAYLYREVNQWRGQPKPAGWWFDAVMDVLFPTFVCSPVLMGDVAFYLLGACVALMHFGLRPVE
jgi:hypothetical protein